MGASSSFVGQVAAIGIMATYVLWLYTQVVAYPLQLIRTRLQSSGMQGQKAYTGNWIYMAAAGMGERDQGCAGYMIVN